MLQDPLDAVNVPPCTTVPLITGGEVFCGAGGDDGAACTVNDGAPMVGALAIPVSGSAVVVALTGAAPAFDALITR